MQPALRLLAGSTLAVVLGAAPSGHRLAWSPAEGTTLERRLEFELEVEFRSGGFEALGRTLALDELGRRFDATDTERSLDLDAQVADLVVAVDGERATVVERTYESVAIDGRADDGVPRRARFAWDRRRARYAAEVLDDDLAPDEAQAAARALREDVDCRWLLPDGEVDAATVWTRELSPQRALELIGIPGMDVAALMRDGMAAESADPVLARAFEPVLANFGDDRRAGSVTAELVGTRVEGGATIAQVRLELDVELHLDLDDFMATAVQRQTVADGEGLPAQIRALALASGEGEGLLEWNLTAGRLHALETNVDYVFELNGSFDMVFEGTERPFSGWASWGGRLKSARTVTER